MTATDLPMDAAEIQAVWDSAPCLVMNGQLAPETWRAFVTQSHAALSLRDELESMRGSRNHLLGVLGAVNAITKKGNLEETPQSVERAIREAVERAAAVTCCDCMHKSPVREVEGRWLHDMTIPGEPAPSYTRRCRAEAIRNMIKNEVKS